MNWPASFLLFCHLIISIKRSSHYRCSIKKAVLKNFVIFTGKHMCWSEYLFNKVAGLKACNFIKERLQDRCFPMNIANFLRTPILKNIYERLLLRKPPLYQSFSALTAAVKHYCTKSEIFREEFL